MSPPSLLEEILSVIPPLNHDELKLLFIAPTFGSIEEVQHIFQLPRETLIADLESLVQFGLEHTEIYERGGEREKHNSMFVVHSVFILAEIRAHESLPVVLNLLRQPREVLDFWIGDFVTECMDVVLADMGRSGVDMLEKFIREENDHLFVSDAAVLALGIMFYRGEISREHLLDIYGKLLEQYTAEEFYGQEHAQLVVHSVANACADFRLTELEGRMVDAAEAVELSAWAGPGELNTLLRDIHSREPVKNPVRDDFISRYTMFSRLDEMNEDDEWDEDEDDDWLDELPPEPFVRPEPKTGRNDPCPCGSGKKYKKCHGA